MAKNRVTVKINNHTIKKAVHKAVEEAIYDVSDDLVRTSSETTPHDKGILEQSFGRSVAWKNRNEIVAVVDYSVKEENGQNGFNYALWIHEGDYNLGENSQKKAQAGGGVGMSGQSYAVGNKYLTRVLYGEEETYKEYIQKKINESIK
jgi:hypothetical protein